jgi:hypothetical protein
MGIIVLKAIILAAKISIVEMKPEFDDPNGWLFFCEIIIPALMAGHR